MTENTLKCHHDKSDTTRYSEASDASVRASQEWDGPRGDILVFPEFIVLGNFLP